MLVSSTRRWESVQRYGLGITTIVLAAVLQLGLLRLAGGGVAFMLFHPALVLIAVYCGRGPALLAVLLSATYTAIALRAFSATDGASPAQYTVLTYIVVGVLVVLVTGALRRATHRAHAAENRLRMVQDDVGVGLWEIDVRRGLFFGSRSLWRLLDRHGPERPTPIANLESTLPEPALEAFKEAMERHVRARARSFEHEFPAPLSNGSVRHCLSRVNIEYDEADSVTFVRAAIVDVTGRKALEAEQQRNLQDLREVDQRRVEFLATLAHELRNPLAPIRHAVLLAQSPHADAEQVRWSLNVIDRQVAHMARLLEDLLEASRISRGALELRPEPVELSAILAVATETAAPLIESKQHALDCQLPNEPIWLHGDPVRLAQVFSNLLTNAAKYTPAKGVIRVIAEGNAEHVAVIVRDNGIGMAPETLPRVFEMFAQASAAQAYSQGGVGIGLALVKGLVQLHGGTVSAHSEGLQRGSEFIVRLPRVGRPASQASSIDPLDGSYSMCASMHT